MVSTWTSLKFCCVVKSELFIAQSRFLMTLSKKSFENIEGKEKNAGKQHLFLFPRCFQLCQRQKS